MKTKILTIAPYQGMKEIINDIASGRDDIEMTTRIGDLATGLEIVQSYDLDDFDIIISRGGTAKMISANVTIPVVEVEISVYDILRAIKLAEIIPTVLPLSAIRPLQIVRKCCAIFFNMILRLLFWMKIRSLTNRWSI